MLTAALGGLLSFGTASCVFSVVDRDDDPTGTTSTTGSPSGSTATTGGAGGATSSSGTSGEGGAGATSTSVSSTDASSSASTSDTVAASSSVSAASTGTGATNPHTPIPDTACADGIIPNPMVTLTTVGPITQPEFEALCADAGGIFEIQPVCGGSNACRGFAYDSGSQTYTEHSCQHTNTCAGYNCVDCD